MLKVEPRAVYADERLIDVDGRVFIVDGKVVCFFKEGLCDLSDDGERDRFVAFGEELYVSPAFPRMYGDETICTLTPTGVDEDGDMVYHTCFWRLSDLPVDLVDAVRRSCDVYDR